MKTNHLHIISFNVPFPANYGGVIDVFYKLKALHSKGIRIHLHCFEYNRIASKELEKYCESINYYKRKTGLLSFLSYKPYIVYSRRSENLIQNLLKDNYPILFEGLHSCYYIDDKRLKNRKKIYRESNIEHQYYFNLFKAEKNVLKKTYFITESIKIKLYEKNLKNVSIMLVVSQSDTAYLKQHFPGKKIYYLPSFHANDDVKIKTGRGKYALYHGNLSVSENDKAANFLIKNVFNNSSIPLVIAGLNPSERLLKFARHNKNIKIISNPSDEEMFNLIREAHVNILLSFQATGLKLKLLNTLYNGRFCLVNNEMVEGTSLRELCIIANKINELRTSLEEIFKREFDSKQIELREQKLKEHYSNEANVERLIGYIF